MTTPPTAIEALLDRLDGFFPDGMVYTAAKAGRVAAIRAAAEAVRAEQEHRAGECPSCGYEPWFWMKDYPEEFAVQLQRASRQAARAALEPIRECGVTGVRLKTLANMVRQVMKDEAGAKQLYALSAALDKALGRPKPTTVPEGPVGPTGSQEAHGASEGV